MYNNNCHSVSIRFGSRKNLLFVFDVDVLRSQRFHVGYNRMFSSKSRIDRFSFVLGRGGSIAKVFSYVVSRFSSSVFDDIISIN